MKQRITLKIAGKETQHLVDAEREEVIRAAADRINQEIDALRFDFRNHELSEVLSMILLSEETKLLELEARTNKPLVLLYAKINTLNKTEPTRTSKTGLGDPSGDSIL